MTEAGTLAWYGRRALAMSPAEVSHRLREQARRLVSRHATYGWERFERGEGALKAPRALLALSGMPVPPAVRCAIEAAARPCQLSFLGQDWPASARLGHTSGLWTLDPVSGAHWPGRGTFCFDVTWRRRTDRGDVKFVLELNRLQSLQPMAALALVDGRPEIAEDAAGIVLDWMAENPPFDGVNWLSGIELALRLVSVAFVAAALEQCCPDHPYRPALRRLVAAHAYWLERFPSLHSSANNHHVAEGLGLLVAAILVPDLEDAPRLRSRGLAILVEAASTQFHSDGWSVEQSPSYGAFTLEMILFGMRLAEAEGETFPPAARQAAATAAMALGAVLDTGGRHPRIGDDDEGRAIACPGRHEERYVASVVAAAAGMLDRPELAPEAHEPTLRDLVLGARTGRRAPSRGVLSFDQGGLTVIRDEMAGRRILFVLDHGPLGLEPLAAHGHADALAVWLHIDDQPVLVDGGTYRYHASGRWRDHLRSTAAHNTVEIGGDSQSVPAGPFNWRHKAKSRRLALESGPDWSIEAEHDGYRSRVGALHRRLCRRIEGGLEIVDVIQPEPKERVRLRFLIDPSLSVRRCGAGVVVGRDGDDFVRLQAEGADLTILTDIEGAAVSPRYNELRGATRIEIVDPPAGRCVTRFIVQPEVGGLRGGGGQAERERVRGC